MKCEAVIDEIIMEPNKIQPIIVKFKNGRLKKEKTKKMKCSLLREKNSTKKQTLLAISNGSNVYVGSKPDPKESPTYTMMAFHNKKTGKVRLVQVDRWQVQLYSQPANDTANTSTDGIKKRMNDLDRKFGSKKTKKILEQNEKLQIDANLMKDDLESAVANVKVNKEDLELPKSEDELVACIPKCNEEAKSVEQIYKIDQIIPQNILDHLLEKVDVMSNADTSKKSAFFKEILEASKDSDKGKEKIAVLMYTEIIITWIASGVRQSTKKVVEMAPQVPEACLHVADTYSVIGASKRRTKPFLMKMKAVMHCLVLALLINNFRVDVEMIIQHLQTRIGITKLMELTRLIRASVSKDKKTIELKLPLPKPLSLVKRFRKSK